MKTVSFSSYDNDCLQPLLAVVYVIVAFSGQGHLSLLTKTYPYTIISIV